MNYTHHEWLATLADLSERGVPCVLITVMEAKGFTPRDAGTKMIVSESETFGTIGGGNLEFEAIAAARSLLMQAIAAPLVKDYPLGPSLAQCCGGSVSVFLEPILPHKHTLYLFGAGHVGREVVRVLEGLPVTIKWVDSRDHEFPDVIPGNCEKIVTASPESVVASIPGNAYIVIMTHNHDLDYELVERCFTKGDFAYLGLIGSDTKRARFEKRLKVNGVAEDSLSRLTCPIGIGGVTGKHPREIAIALAAELLSLGMAQ